MLLVYHIFDFMQAFKSYVFRSRAGAGGLFSHGAAGTRAAFPWFCRSWEWALSRYAASVSCLPPVFARISTVTIISPKPRKSGRVKDVCSQNTEMMMELTGSTPE